MNILFFDVETTGQDETKHTVTELAFRLDSDGKTVDKFSIKLFNPKCVTNLQALAYNGQRLQNLLSSEFKPEDKATVEACDWLLTALSKVKGTVHWCGHHVAFDIRFFKALLRRYDIEGLDQAIGSWGALDTFCLGFSAQQSGLIATEKDKLNLPVIATALGIDVTKFSLHKAEDDVALTAEVYYKLVERFKSVRK